MKLERILKETQAVWGELTAEAKRVSNRKRAPLFVAGYAAGEEPWALFLLPPEPAMEPLQLRLLFVEKRNGHLTTHWGI